MQSFQRRYVVWILGLLLAVGARGVADNASSEDRLRRDVTFLASDECEGRGVGTKGIEKAAEYVAKQFAEAGLKPGGVKGSYYQPFTMSGASKIAGPATLILQGPLGQTIELKLDTHFQLMGLSGSGKIEAPLVFAGYGINAKDLNYDDYQGIDVAGKIVILLRHTPRYANSAVPFGGSRRDEFAALEKKAAQAEVRKAAGLIVLNDVTEAGDKLMPFTYLSGATPSSIPALHVHRNVLEPVLRSALGMDLVDIERAIDRDLKPRSAVLKGWTASIEATVKRETLTVKNVIGVVDGSGPLADETVVVGAHYDHLGFGGRSSRAKDPNRKDIHHGADDNASGTSTMMELARRFAHMPERQGRRLVFIAFSAEESGLLGSRHYCNKEPLFPLDKTSAMVNLDMVGRMQEDPKTHRDKLLVEGVGTAKGFESLVDKLNPGLQLSKKPGGTGPSDHDSFYRKKVPVIFFWTGTHADYHKPSDTSDKINVAGMRKIADLAEKTIAYLASEPTRPQYVEVASSSPSPSSTKGPRLGIVPNYEEDKDGLPVGGVQDGGPAATAGVKAGDIIVEIAGKQVKNINTYMVLMAEQRIGQTIEIGVLRDGKKVKLKVDLK